MPIASTFWILDHQLGQSMYIAKHPGLMWIDLYLIAEATVLSLLFLLLMTHYAGPVLFIAIVLADILIFLLGLFFAMGIFFDPFNTVGCFSGWMFLLHCSTSAYEKRRLLCWETPEKPVTWTWFEVGSVEGHGWMMMDVVDRFLWWLNDFWLVLGVPIKIRQQDEVRRRLIFVRVTVTLHLHCCFCHNCSLYRNVDCYRNLDC